MIKDLEKIEIWQRKIADIYPKMKPDTESQILSFQIGNIKHYKSKLKFKPSGINKSKSKSPSLENCQCQKISITLQFCSKNKASENIGTTPEEIKNSVPNQYFFSAQSEALAAVPEVFLQQLQKNLKRIEKPSFSNSFNQLI